MKSYRAIVVAAATLLSACGSEDSVPSKTVETSAQSTTTTQPQTKSSIEYFIFPQDFLTRPGRPVTFQIYKRSGFFSRCVALQNIDQFHWKSDVPGSEMVWSEDKLSGQLAAATSGTYHVSAVAPDGTELSATLTVVEGAMPNWIYPSCL
jgi:hypothetical protein